MATEGTIRLVSSTPTAGIVDYIKRKVMYRAERGRKQREKIEAEKRALDRVSSQPRMQKSLSDEDPQFWREYTREDLASRCAVLHRQRREASGQIPAARVEAAREMIGSQFLSGRGVEVGAGLRPFPIPKSAKVLYGEVRTPGFIDAQTFASIPDVSQDFVISAHVLEHLQNPVGSICAAIRVLKPGGIHLLVIPDMRHTFDRTRPETTVEHVAADFTDGGRGTRLQAYVEHVTYVHPLAAAPIDPSKIDAEAKKIMAASMDIHYHAWTKEGAQKMLDFATTKAPFTTVCAGSIENENIFVLRKAR